MKNTKKQEQNYKPFQIKLDGTLPGGKKITPETLSIEKFGQVFHRFRKLVEVALEKDREALEQVNFQYKKGSAYFVSDLPANAHQVIQEEVRQIEAGHPINLSVSEIANSLVELKKFVTDMGDDVKVTVGSEDENYIEITKDTKFEQLKDVVVDTESIVYGKLYSVGGKTPNIHLYFGDHDGKIIIDVTEGQAKELANSLYNEIGVKVAVKQNMLTREISSAQYKDRLPFSRVLDEEKFARDKERGTRIWAGIDPVAWEQEQRGGNT